MKIILTICTANKDASTDLLPAKKRYLSNRIKIVDQIAQKENLPFYILSGKFGIIKADKPIPWYDKQLKQENTEALLPVIIDQLKQEKITEIVFYGKSKDEKGWIAYHEVLERATRDLNIQIKKNILKNY